MADNTNLNLESISITSMIDSIVGFFNSQENNSRWASLTQGTEGVSFIRFISNIMTNLSYRMVTARRENYITTANLPTSNIGIAINLGYSVFRGTNEKRTITITPNETVTIPPLSIIGNYNTDYSIINLDQLTLVKDVSQEISTVIGNTKTIDITAGTTNVNLFQLFTTNISEDFLLYQNYASSNPLLLPVSNKIKDMADDYYLVRTNPYQSVDILYLNNNPSANYKYGTETVFTLKYVEIAEVLSIPYNSSMFLYGTLLNTKIIQLYQPFEDVSNIKIKAPLAHETQNIIRSKQDFTKDIIETIVPVITSAYKLITPTYTTITYLKNDTTTLTDTEVLTLDNNFNSQEFLGTPSPDIEAPKLNFTNLDIELKLANKYTSITDINTGILNILNTNYALKLANTLNTFDIEILLEKLSYVKYARVNFNINSRVNSTRYNLGDIFKQGNLYYIIESILGISGNLEPNWNVPLTNIHGLNFGVETLDGDVVWTVYKRIYNLEGIIEWQPNTGYKVGDFVYSTNYANYMFKCTDILKRSNSQTVDFSNATLGDFVPDGEIIWVCKPLITANPYRTNNTVYRLGDSIQQGNYSFECISYSGMSDNTSTTFELLQYPIVNQQPSYVELSGNYFPFFKLDDIIQGHSSSIINTYSIQNVTYDSISNTTRLYLFQVLDTHIDYITSKQVGTKDNELFINILLDNTNIVYPWNVYNNFNYSLTVS